MRIEIKLWRDDGTLLYQFVTPTGERMEWIPFPTIVADGVYFYGLRVDSCTRPAGLPDALQVMPEFWQGDTLPAPDVEVGQ